MHCHASCSADHGSEHSRNLRSPHPSLPAPLQLPLTANPVTQAASRNFHSFRYHCLLLAVNKKRRIKSRSNLSRSVCVLAALCVRVSLQFPTLFSLLFLLPTLSGLFCREKLCYVQHNTTGRGSSRLSERQSHTWCTSVRDGMSLLLPLVLLRRSDIFRMFY